MKRGSSTFTGPPGICAIACSMIRSDCRISSIRTMYRSQTSPCSPMGMSKSNRS